MTGQKPPGTAGDSEGEDGVGGEPTDAGDGRDPPERTRGRLLLDVMLGKLATYLRMCGYDAAYALDRDVEADNRLLALARAENRTLLTRDRGLASRRSDSVLLTAREIDDQLRELREAGFALELDDRPTFCGRCNGRVERVGASEPTPGYAPDPAETDVWRCRDCGQHFWQGSHWEDVRETLAEL